MGERPRSMDNPRQGADTASTVRRARPTEAEFLSAVARRSKGHWGYDPDFLEACRDELTLTPEFIRSREVWVLEMNNRILGYYALVQFNSRVELDHLFVDPPAIGKGAGRLLWEDAIERARSLGYEELLIQSDPHAEGFYRRLGAERIGLTPSGSVPGRQLPLLRFNLNDDRE